MRHPEHPWRLIGFAAWITVMSVVALFAMWKQQQFAHYLDGQCEQRQVARAITREGLLAGGDLPADLRLRVESGLAPIECR